MNSQDQEKQNLDQKNKDQESIDFDLEDEEEKQIDPPQSDILTRKSNPKNNNNITPQDTKKTQNDSIEVPQEHSQDGQMRGPQYNMDRWQFTSNIHPGLHSEEANEDIQQITNISSGLDQIKENNKDNDDVSIASAKKPLDPDLDDIVLLKEQLQKTKQIVIVDNTETKYTIKCSKTDEDTLEFKNEKEDVFKINHVLINNQNFTLKLYKDQEVLLQIDLYENVYQENKQKLQILGEISNCVIEEELQQAVFDFYDDSEEDSEETEEEDEDEEYDDDQSEQYDDDQEQQNDNNQQQNQDQEQDQNDDKKNEPEEEVEESEETIVDQDDEEQLDQVQQNNQNELIGQYMDEDENIDFDNFDYNQEEEQQKLVKQDKQQLKSNQIGSDSKLIDNQNQGIKAQDIELQDLNQQQPQEDEEQNQELDYETKQKFIKQSKEKLLKNLLDKQKGQITDQNQFRLDQEKQALEIKKKKKGKIASILSKQDDSSDDEDESQQLSKKDKILQEKKLNGEQKFDLLCKLRSIFRTLLHLTIITCIVLFFVIYYIYSYDIDTEKFEIEAGNDITLELKNCLVNLVDHDKDSEVEILHYIHYPIPPFSADEGSITNFEIKRDDNENDFHIIAQSAYSDMKYCFLEVKLPKQISQYGNLKVNCTKNSECVVVQKGEQKRFKNVDFSVKGEESVLSMNFEDIYFENFNFISENRGLIYLQKFEAPQNAQSNIKIEFGEAVLQSTNDYKISFTNYFQSICYNAPHIIQENDLACDISQDSIGTYTATKPVSYFEDKINSDSQTDVTTNDGENTNTIQSDDRLKGCKGTVLLCKEETCDGNVLPNFNVVIGYTGNIYANYIEQQGFPPNHLSNSQFDLLKGAVYDNGINYNDNSLNVIEEFYNSGQAETEPIWIVDLGNKFIQLSTHQLWVKSTNPSFALMRPWWLATWSFSLLVTQTQTLEGYLQPGFCPYSTSLTIDQYWEVKQFLASSLKTTEGVDRSSITFIQHESKDLPQEKNTKQNGVVLMDYEKQVSQEKWYEVKEEKGVKVEKEYNQSRNPLILVSLLLSMAVSLCIVVATIYILIQILPIFKNQLSEESGQFEKYTSTIAANNKSQKLLEENDSDDDDDVGRVAINMGPTKKKKKMLQPSFVASLDFYSFLATRKQAKSYQVFFSVLFMRADPETEKQLVEGQIDSEELLEIKERKLKNLYEKFCFLNHLTEVRLSDENVVSLLEKKYGYQFVQDGQANQVFVKIAQKRKVNLPDPSFLKQKDSLETYISLYYDITGRDTDDVWVEELEEGYTQFYRDNRLKKVEFRTETIAEKYKLIVTEKPQLKLVLKKSSKKQQDTDKKTEQQQNQNQATGKYLIKQSQLQLHVDLMSDPGTFTDKYLTKLSLCQIIRNEIWDIIETFLRFRPYMKFNNEEQAFLDTIYGKMWLWTDTRIVLQHFLLNAALIAPIFIFMIINQIYYAPYSLNHPAHIFSQSDLKFSLVYLPWFIGKSDLTLIICMSVIFTFIIVQALNEFGIFFMAKFPVDRAFEQERKKGDGLQTKFQFFIMLVLIAFAVFYVSMNMMWLLLGAIINPNFFLVYASSVVTLITFVTSKKKAFDEIYKGGIDMIKDILLKEYTKKVQSIMGSIEAEKSSILSQAQGAYDSAKSEVISTASAVGLGDEAQSMIGDVENTFKSVEKMTPEDLDPQNIKKKAEELEAKMKQQALLQIQKQLTGYGLSENLSKAIFMLVIEKNQKDSSLIIADEISKKSDGKLPSKLISWILETILNKKSMNPKSMQKDLQDNIIEIILQTVLGEVQPELRQQIRNLISLVMAMIDALQDNDLSGIINIFKELVFLLPLQSGQDWTFSPTPTFVLKFLLILKKIFSGEANSNELGFLMQDCLKMAQIPDEIGMFLTIMPSQKNCQKWQYQNIKIESMEQLRSFVESNVVQKICSSQNIDSKQTKFVSYIFTSVFKLMRGDNNFQDEIEYASKLMQNEVKKVIKNFTENVKDKVDKEQKKQESNMKKSISDLIEQGKQLIKFVPITLKNQEDIQKTIQNLSSESNFPLNHIKGLILTSTSNIYIKITQTSREEQLIEESQFLSDISESFGVEQSVLLGFLDLYHDKEDINDTVHEREYMTNFQNFLFKTLRTKSELQQTLIKGYFKIMKTRNMWELQHLLEKLLKKSEIKSYLFQQAQNKVNYKYKIFLEITKFLDKGDIFQISQFITPSFANQQQQQIIKLFEQLFEIKEIRSELLQQYNVNQKQQQKNNNNPQGRNSRVSVVSASLEKQKNQKNKKNKDQNQEFDTFIETKKNSYITKIKKIFDNCTGKGDISLFQIKREKNLIRMSVIEFFSNIFMNLGLSKSAERLLISLFKVCYLKVNPQGFDKNDRLRIISELAKELKMTNLAMSQLMAFLNISLPQSKQIITGFYTQNNQLLPKCENSALIEQSCSSVLDYIKQIDTLNSKMFDFIFEEKKIPQKQQMSQSSNKKIKIQESLQQGLFGIIKNFTSSEQIFNAIFDGSNQTLGKDQICILVKNMFNLLEQFDIISQKDIQTLMPIFYQIFFFEEQFNFEKLLELIPQNQKDKILKLNIGSEISLLINIIKKGINEDGLGILNIIKELMLKKITNLYNKQMAEFIFDIIATLNTTENQKKKYHPGKLAKTFYDYFPLIQYRFTDNISQFVHFTQQICKSIFKFDSISSKELTVIFSLFDKQPDIQDAQSLLQIDSYILEMGYGISQLITHDRPYKIIDQFVKFPGFKNMCLQSRLSEKEVILLLKLTLKCFQLQDLDQFIDVFGMKQQLDIDILKGFFAFLLPVTESSELTQADLKYNYIRNYNSRKYLYNELSKKEKLTVTDNIIQSQQYEIIEFFYNINQGRFQNLFYQIQDQKLIKSIKLFGGQKYIRQTIAGIIGLVQNSTQLEDTECDKIQETFQNIRKGATPVSNSVQTALYYLNESIFQDFIEFSDPNHLKVMFSPPLDIEAQKVLAKKQEKQDYEMSEFEYVQKKFFQISQLSYSTKLKAIETTFITVFSQNIEANLNQNDEKEKELPSKMYELREKLLDSNPSFIGQYDYYINSSKIENQDEQDILNDLYPYIHTTDFIQQILQQTLQQMRYNQQKQKEFYKNNTKLSLKQFYEEKCLLQYILDLEIVFTCISRLYLLESEGKATEFFRKNYLMELFLYANQPLYKELLQKKNKTKGQKSVDIFKKFFNYILPSNPSCYIDIDEEEKEYEIFREIFYSEGEDNKKNKKILEKYETLLNKFSEIYINTERFTIIDDLQNSFQNCQEYFQKLNSEQQKPQPDAVLSNTQIGGTKILKSPLQELNDVQVKILKKQDYCKEYKKMLAKRINLERQAIKDKTIKAEQGLRLECMTILKKNITELKQNLLTNNLGIKGTIEKIYESNGSVLGSEQTKNLIINILKIQQQDQRNYRLVGKVVNQLENMHSNVPNLETLLEILCNPDKDEKIIANFIKIFIGERNAQQFQSLFYIQLLKNNKINLKKLASLEIIKQSEQDPAFKAIKDEKQKKALIQTFIKERENEMINDALQSLFRNLKISVEQQRMLMLLLQCFAGQNQSWLLLFTEKIKLFDPRYAQIAKIGNEFLLAFFTFQESVCKIIKKDKITDIKITKNFNLQSLISEISQKHDITKEFSFVENFFADKNNIPFQVTPQDQKTIDIVQNIIHLYSSHSNDTEKIIDMVLTQNIISENIPESIIEIGKILNSYTLKQFFKNPSQCVYNVEEIMQEVQHLFKLKIEEQLTTPLQKTIFEDIFQFFQALISDSPLISISSKIFSIVLEYKDKFSQNQEDLKIISMSTIVCQILSNVSNISFEDGQQNTKLDILLYFGSLLLNKFYTQFFPKEKPIQIIKDIIKEFEDKYENKNYWNELVDEFKYCQNYKQKKSIIENFDDIKNFALQYLADKFKNLGQEIKEEVKNLEKNIENGKEKERKNKITDYQCSEQILTALKPLNQIFSNMFNILPQDSKLQPLVKFIKTMFYNFSGLFSTEKGSKAWQLIKNDDYMGLLEQLILVISEEEEFDRCSMSVIAGIILIGQTMLIGFDVLKNKDTCTIRDFLMKYDFLLKDYTDSLTQVIGIIIEDEQYLRIVESLMEFLLKIFQDTDITQDDLIQTSEELLENIQPLFINILNQTMGKQTKNKEYFGDSKKYEDYQNLIIEIDKQKKELNNNLKTINTLTKDYKKAKDHYITFVEQKPTINQKNKALLQETEEKIEKYNKEKEQKYQEKLDLQEQNKLIKQEMKNIENQISESDVLFVQIRDNIQYITNTIKDTQKVFKNDLEPMINDFKVNGFDIKIFINKFVPIVVQLVSSAFDESSQIFIVKITESLIHLINGEFDQIDDELFLILQLNPKDVANVRQILQVFSSGSCKPLEVLEQKKKQTLDFISKKANDSSFKQFNKIKEKMDEQGLSPKDMFKLADIDGNGDIDMREFRMFFKKLGIDLSEHRVQEIFASAKQGQASEHSAEQTLDQDEFIKAYEYVQSKSMFLTLESMGITKQKLTFILIGLVFLLVLIFVFIFIGVSAFAIPGTFGAIVNSAFPALGGGGVSKSQESDPAKTLNLTKIKKTVQDSIATIQSSGI